MASTSKKGPPAVANSPKTPTGTKPSTSMLGDVERFFTDARVRREYIEMVAFVLVLVCFLRMFGTEAYVIPSGSMAPTLMGANKCGKCPECGQINFVNAKGEAEGERIAKPNGESIPFIVKECLCQNCQHPLEFMPGGFSSGDRILVDKLVYTRSEPKRWDVAVFKFPDGVRKDGPQFRSARSNYIKRMVGTPGEKIGIDFGDIYVGRNTDADDKLAIARKPPVVLLATRRLVYDNSRKPKDLADDPKMTRWTSEGERWKETNNGSFECNAEQAPAVLAYRNIWRPEILHQEDPTPSLITDFEAYNSENYQMMYRQLGTVYAGCNWVGDLMVEADVLLKSGQGRLTLSLREGPREVRCVFDASNSRVLLYDGEAEVAAAPSPLKVGSSAQVRFAHVDDRLTLWVGGSLVFGDGIDLSTLPREQRGPTVADLRPVKIEAIDVSATISSLKLFRDIYYTKGEWPAQPPAFLIEAGYHVAAINRHSSDAGFTDLAQRAEPGKIDEWRKFVLATPIRPFLLNEDEFLMFGDNSPQSADARDWSEDHRVVHRRSLLGRSIVRFWPFVRMEGGWPTLEWKFTQ